ncbi:unnamed protein product [Closterium sp. NIES-54]
MWIFRVKRLPGSPPAFKARYVARGFSQRQGVDYFQTFSPTPKMTTLRVSLHVAAQRDYELHTQDFTTAFLQGSLHEEIWLRPPLCFTRSFPVGTQWSLRRPVYGLRQAPHEWHDTLRTTLAALGFTASIADTSLFLRTNMLLQITLDRARRTITLTMSHMVHQVLQRSGFQFSSPLPTPLSTSHSLSAPPSDESVEPSGPYPELVVFLMVLRYLCSTSSMGLVLGGRGPVVLTGHANTLLGSLPFPARRFSRALYAVALLPCPAQRWRTTLAKPARYCVVNCARPLSTPHAGRTARALFARCLQAARADRTQPARRPPCPFPPTIASTLTAHCRPALHCPTRCVPVLPCAAYMPPERAACTFPYAARSLPYLALPSYQLAPLLRCLRC